MIEIEIHKRYTEHVIIVVEYSIHSIDYLYIKINQNITMYFFNQRKERSIKGIVICASVLKAHSFLFVVDHNDEGTAVR